ncbi:hypothetical protein C1646_778182 [Rhizophagus diaphanus]|nr:hypothetical protein C1646_778182 [Rhizophagus diaphanus] [Rhizophagus sp. MUCL 43196]
MYKGNKAQVRTMLADSNKAMHWEYISTILHALLYIVKKITDKELTLALQLEVVGKESTGLNFSVLRINQSKVSVKIHAYDKHLLNSSIPSSPQCN